MPTKLLKVTPSKLSTWASCPRRYRMAYLDRPAPPRGGAWAHSTLGAVVHLALRAVFDAPAQRRTVAAARDAVTRAWSGEGFADENQQALYRARAQDWVAEYVAEAAPADVEVVGLERWVAAPVGTLVVEGRVDRIDRRPNPGAPDGEEVVVVDYKTGRRPTSDDEARSSQALALYVLAVRRTLRRACRRVELHHVPTGQVHSYEHTAASLERQLGRAQEQAQDIALATDTLAAGADADDVFPPRPGPQCSWCDFRRSCPQGRAGSPELDPWAGLAP